jgi:DNA polymerase III delta prime subunit
MISANHQSKQNIPWVEKYRPNQFDDIVLDPINRRIFENILSKDYFPNLIFYGPPGTGKTTTIINLINEYQQRYNQVNKGSIIHLNASDERGIDIIRNQIYQFVKSKNFFEAGLKFVILDEVDYMTKNAQQALKYLLQSSCYNVRFCLICNYISKIDESLKNEFICIRFNQLPKNDIYKFIKQIAENENLDLNDSVIDMIQNLYNSDIRSMINFLQLNQNISQWESNIITDDIWEKIHQLLLLPETSENQIFTYINNISIQYNTDKKTIIKNYFNYIIRNKKQCVTKDFLAIVEGSIHVTDSNIQHILLYFIHNLQDYYKSKSIKRKN